MSYYELSVDDEPFEKQKSSGLIVCTGTGSTSWYQSANRLHSDTVKRLLEVVNSRSKEVHIPTDDDRYIDRIAIAHNAALPFQPTDLHMAYSVRDPLHNSIYEVREPSRHASTFVFAF